jgi:hypothetical protein
MAKKSNPSLYLVQDYHDTPNHEDLRKDMRQGHVWSEFGPNNLEGTHSTNNDVSSTVAKADASVADLERAAKLGRPTSVSGANLAKMGDMRVPSDAEYGAGVELEHKDSLYHGINPKKQFAHDVDRLEEFHTSLHGQSAAEDNTCSMCRG